MKKSNNHKPNKQKLDMPEILRTPHGLKYTIKLSNLDKKTIKTFFRNNAKGYFTLHFKLLRKVFKEYWLIEDIKGELNKNNLENIQIFIVPFIFDSSNFSMSFSEDQLKCLELTYKSFDDKFLKICRKDFNLNEIFKNQKNKLSMDMLTTHNQELIKKHDKTGFLVFSIFSDIGFFEEIWRINKNNFDNDPSVVNICPYNVNPYKNSFVVPHPLYNKEKIEFKPSLSDMGINYKMNNKSINSNWCKFYKEIAYKLLDYKDNYRYLGKQFNKEFDKYKDELPQGELYNRFYYSTDPYMVYGFFNIPLKPDEKIRLAKIVKKVLSLDSEVPHDFNSCSEYDLQEFLKYAEKHFYNCGTKIWDLLEVVLEYTKNKATLNKKRLIKVMNESLTQEHIDFNITALLSYICPEIFVSLTSDNYNFLQDIFTISPEIALDVRRIEKIIDAEEYFILCEKIMGELNKNAFDYNNIFELTYFAKSYSDIELSPERFKNYVELIEKDHISLHDFSPEDQKTIVENNGFGKIIFHVTTNYCEFKETWIFNEPLDKNEIEKDEIYEIISFDISPHINLELIEDEYLKDIEVSFEPFSKNKIYM